ncbi:Uncharacterised protein [Acinetobacter haemolyticus]|nr:hypothetical protein [Acinetobacter haemolyticus]SPT48088.1 Uncharacterised protein [Acinetobacter haemolyticus]
MNLEKYKNFYRRTETFFEEISDLGLNGYGVILNGLEVLLVQDGYFHVVEEHTFHFKQRKE